MVKCHEGIGVPRGGVFEPALAVFFFKDKGILRQFSEAEGHWVPSQELEPGHMEEPQVNEAFELTKQMTSRELQVFDNFSFDLKTSTLRLSLPLNSKGRLEIGNKSCLALVDIQQYRLVSRPVVLSAVLPIPTINVE